MSIIKFIQIGCSIREGSPTFLNAIKRAQIPYAVSFMYVANENAQGRDCAPYGSDEATTIVMVEEKSIDVRAAAYSEVKDKVIILLPATQPQREFNLGMAVGMSSTLAHGVYIANKGKVSRI